MLRAIARIENAAERWSLAASSTPSPGRRLTTPAGQVCRHRGPAHAVPCGKLADARFAATIVYETIDLGGGEKDSKISYSAPRGRESLESSVLWPQRDPSAPNSTV